MNYFTKHAQQSIATARDAFLRHGRAATIPDEAVGDLLTDLRHFCQAQHIDFDRENKIAAFRFQRERSVS